MKALHIVKYGRMPQIRNVPIPQRKDGQMLIKMKYAPINPSDLNFYLGFYGIRKEGFPIVGFEGSGIVLQSSDKSMVGRRVSVLADNSNGTHATHLVTNPQNIIVWPQGSEHSIQSISMACINPISCIGLARIAKAAQAKSVVLSAVTSNVNKMLIRYLRQKEGKALQIIGVSRSPQYDQQIIRLGANEVVRMEDIPKIKELTGQGRSAFLDCVGGEFAGKVFNALPKDSIMVNYGRLSKQNLGGIDLGGLYFGNKTIRGFWMNTFLQQLSRQEIRQVKQEVIRHARLFEQPVRKIYPLQGFAEAMKESIKNQSEGKILLDLS